MRKLLAIIATIMVLQLVIVPATYAAPPAWGGDDDCGDEICYVVQRGDTLFKIGREFGVDPYYIAQVNGLYNPNCIYAGQVLYIPADDCCGFEGGMGYYPWPGYGPGGGMGYYPQPGPWTYQPLPYQNPTPPGYGQNPTPPGYYHGW